MNYPDFFDTVERIKLHDELAQFLGSAEDGLVEFSFSDIAKAAGHSCPTVAGAYLMVLEGLKTLYPGEVAKRGEIRVEFKESVESGVAGVIGTVVANITGATTNYGFKGIGGRFNRTNLMFFDRDIESNMRLTRIDTGSSVDVFYAPGKVVQPGEIMQTVMSPNASEEQKKNFPILWQQMIEKIFANSADVISVQALSA